MFQAITEDEGPLTFLVRMKRMPAAPAADAEPSRCPRLRCRAWRRHQYLMLDGFRAERAPPLPEPPMTGEQVYRPMVGMNGPPTCH